MISLILGGASTVAAVIGMQLKKQWQIVLSQCISNLLVACSYFFLDLSKMSGAIICIIGALQTFINFLFLKKKQGPPKLVTAFFLLAYIVASFVVANISGNMRIPYDFLPMLGSVFFLLGVSTKSATTARYMFFFNILVWITYDLMAEPIAYGSLLTHTCIFISVVTGIIRYGFSKKTEADVNL